MCGITGAVDPDINRAATTVARLNDRQAHRGPDDDVVARIGPFTIGNTRLAINDLSPAGNQPLYSCDGRIACVFNGEIYNANELRARFSLKTSSMSDGAVVPELWARMGIEALDYLEGMYGVAVIDAKKHELVLARDPFGIKPLYVRRMSDGVVLFASEPRALASVDPRPSIAAEAVASYLHLGAVPPEMSGFVGIEGLAPGEACVLDASGVVTQSQRRPVLVDGPSLTLTDEFERTVDQHLRSDVPTALLLSGGFDSGALAAGARRGGHSLHCLSVGGFARDEIELAARTAEQYGHAREVVPATVDEEAIDSFFRAMQRPSIDGLNTFVVSRAVKGAGFKVALSGLGGDEALGGYSHYRLLRQLGPLKVLDRVPGAGALLARVSARFSERAKSPKAERLLAGGGPRTPWELDLLQRELFPTSVVSALTGVEPSNFVPMQPLVARSGEPFKDLAMAETALYLQAMLLPDADAFSMACSVELRVPFLDRRFFTAAINASAVAPFGAGKQRFAHQLGDAFLEAVAQRSKKGFTLPMSRWLAAGKLDGAVKPLDDAEAPIWRHVDPSIGRRLLATSNQVRWAELWSFVALNGWLQSITQDSAP